MKLVWTTSAKRDLREVISYIWTYNPSAARKIRERIERLARNLESQPFLGRPGAIAETREAIPHPNYRIVYQVVDETVYIVSVIHTSRQWPPLPDSDG